MNLKLFFIILLGLIGSVPGLTVALWQTTYWFNNPTFTQMEIFKEFFWWDIGMVILSISCYFIINKLNSPKTS